MQRAQRGSAEALVISAQIRSRILAFLTLVLATVVALPGRAAGTRTLVLYVEAEGTDPNAMRPLVRQGIPPQFVVADASDFRAAMTDHGQVGPLSHQLTDPKTRTQLFERMRQAADQIHADGIVYAAMLELRQTRLIRIVVIDPKSDKALMDHRITLPPKKAGKDAELIKDALGPVLEAFTPPPAPPPTSTTLYNPRVGTPATTGPVGPTITPPPTTPAVPADKGPAPNAGFVLRVFPVAGLYSTAALKIGIPVDKKLLIVPQVGGAYQAPAAKGVTDVPYILGGGFRLLPAKGWTVEPSFTYFTGSKFLAISRGSVGLGAVVSPKFKFNSSFSVARYFYDPGVGPPGRRVDEIHLLVDATINPWKGLNLTPVAGAFVFDKSLRGAKSGLTALAIGIAPYPLDGYLGLNVGWNTGRLIPYLTVRRYFYTIDIGAGDSAGLGVRLAVGPDFIDARAGLLLSNAHGPVANPQLEKIPVANLETGFTF